MEHRVHLELAQRWLPSSKEHPEIVSAHDCGRKMAERA
jgi:hypothetical protein